MKKAACFVLVAALAAACATTDDEPQAPPRGGGRRMPPGGGYGGEMRGSTQQDALGLLLPPPNWWHDPQISTAVKLTDAQFTALDAIGREHTAEIDRLRLDAAAAERDVRLLLVAEHPTADDIVTAGRRVRTLRDQTLDHQLRMLADERSLLTREQWTTLQNQLRDERSQFGRERGGFGRGGGRRGPGGRRPGF